MPAVQQFEDLVVWKEARILTKAIYACSSDGKWARDFGLRDQIRRATVSIMSNIAEGFERGGDVEFLRFLSIAKGSAGEVRTQLHVALDLDYLSRERFEDLCGQVLKISRLLSSLMSYLRESEFKGNRFK